MIILRLLEEIVILYFFDIKPFIRVYIQCDAEYLAKMLVIDEANYLVFVS